MNQEEIVENQEVLEVETSEVEPVTDEAVTDAPAESDASEVVEEQPKGRSEAAKYRTRLRETEAERDALQGRIEGMQKSVIIQAMAKFMDAPEVLFKLGLDAGAYFQEDGTVDTQRLYEDAQALADENTVTFRRPYPSNRPVPDLAGGTHPGTYFEEAATWQKALQGGR